MNSAPLPDKSGENSREAVTAVRKPRVVIFCRNISPSLSPFNSDYYWNAYMDLFELLQENGAEAFFATDNSTYLGDGIFDKAYTSEGKVPVEELVMIRNIKADVIYDKGGFNRDDYVLTLNPGFVHHITSNKQRTYEHFSKYQPLTIPCNSAQDILTAVMMIPGEKIVMKYPEGNGGELVHIVDRDDVEPILPNLQYPQIVQEFVDSSIGIPGMVDGYHDLRIKIGGGDVWGGTLRTPKPGELRANVAQGGTERHLFPDEIPSEAIMIAKEIDQYFADYPRYYSIDLIHTEAGWKLLELNSKPGLSPIDMQPQSKNITQHLARYLCELAKERQSKP
ncbi:MAG: hypothetical protein WBB94_01125 [Candidatus Saccharimonadaceae bacterium]